MKIQKRLSELVNKVLESRPLPQRDAQEELRFLQYTALFVMAELAMSFFGIYHYLAGRLIVASLLFILVLCMIGFWWMIYNGIRQSIAYRLNCLLYCLLNLYALTVGNQDHSVVFWMFIAPLVLFYFMGKKEGTFWTGFLWLSSGVIFYLLPAKDNYPPVFIVRFMAAFSLIFVLTSVYELFRDQYRQDMLEKNKKLKTEVQERAKAEKSLKESEARYKAIYYQAVEGILLADANGEIVDCNPQILKMLGYLREQMIGRSVFSFFNPDNLQKIPSQLDRLLAGETILIDRQMRTVSGMYLYCEQSGRLISDDLIILLYRDVTERKVAELALEKANQALEELANKDGLTGVANRRRLDTLLPKEWQRMFREKKQLGFILCDIDYFKQFNDIYGHQAGDDCLTRVARALKDSVHRPADLVARYGGEEFVVLLPDTNDNGCKMIAERLCRMVEDLALSHEGSQVSQYVTISCGFSCMAPGPGKKLEQLVSRADRALYVAKDNGRNQVAGSLERVS